MEKSAERGGELVEDPMYSSPTNPHIRERGTPPSDESNLDCKRFHFDGEDGSMQNAPHQNVPWVRGGVLFHVV